MIAADRSQHELNVALAETVSHPKFEVAMHMVHQGSMRRATKRTPRLAQRTPIFDCRIPDLAIDGQLLEVAGVASAPGTLYAIHFPRRGAI